MLRHLPRRTGLAALVLLGTPLAAAAWQLPKAQPAPKVAACPEMGEGFVRIPGSSTCIRMSGFVRVEALRGGGGASYNPAGR